MVINIVAVILGIVALLLTFRVEWVLKKFFKKEDPTIEEKLKVKCIAFAIAVIAFAAVLVLR